MIRLVWMHALLAWATSRRSQAAVPFVCARSSSPVPLARLISATFCALPKSTGVCIERHWGTCFGVVACIAIVCHYMWVHTCANIVACHDGNHDTLRYLGRWQQSLPSSRRPLRHSVRLKRQPRMVRTRTPMRTRRARIRRNRPRRKLIPLLRTYPPPLLHLLPPLLHLRRPLPVRRHVVLPCCAAQLTPTYSPTHPPGNEAKAAALAEEFPSFDAGLIASLLEDQGGDELEVRFYLKVWIYGADACTDGTWVVPAPREHPVETYPSLLER